MAEFNPYAAFADDLHTLIASRESVEQTGDGISENEWLEDPERSYAAFLGNIYADRFSTRVDADGDLRISSPEALSPAEYARGIVESYASCLTDTDEVSVEYHDQAQAAVRHIQGRLRKGSTPEEMNSACIVLGYIAAATKPEGISAGSRPVKHKGETSEQRTFRMATSELRRFISSKALLLESEAFEYIRRSSSMSPDAIAHRALERLSESSKGARPVYSHERIQQYSDAINRAVARNKAAKIYEWIFSEQTTAEGVLDEFAAWEQIWLQQDKANSADELIIDPTVETNWTILPPRMLEQLGIVEVGDSTKGSEGSLYAVDKDRLRFMGSVVLDWGEGAYIAVANLKATGEHDYRAAILPERRPDGTVLEHGFVENPQHKNAGFVFRAERGLSEDGTVWLDWRGVFSDNKKDAELLGARRLLHVPNFQQNVWEYLTRPPQDLDKKGYKR